MKLFFRKGKKEDAELVAPLIVAAMGELAYKFVGMHDYEQACQLFEYFIAQENNQYSYQNLFVAELNNEIAGIILGYNGCDLEKLRRPFLDYLKEKFNVHLNNIENETSAGEFYLDCISIVEKFQGKGIAGNLIKYLSEYKSNNSELPLGLIVEKDNIPAKKAYLKAGFEILGEKQFAGQCYWHMQLK